MPLSGVGYHFPPLNNPKGSSAAPLCVSLLKRGNFAAFRRNMPHYLRPHTYWLLSTNFPLYKNG